MTVLLREAIGDRLRHARRTRKRTLRDISRVARVSLGYLSEVERGQKEASSELLASICEALDLPLSDLLTSVAADVVAEDVSRLDPFDPAAASVPSGGLAAPPESARGATPVGRMVKSYGMASARDEAADHGVVSADQGVAVARDASGYGHDSLAQEYPDGDHGDGSAVGGVEGGRSASGTVGNESSHVRLVPVLRTTIPQSGTETALVA